MVIFVLKLGLWPHVSLYIHCIALPLKKSAFTKRINGTSMDMNVQSLVLSHSFGLKRIMGFRLIYVYPQAANTGKLRRIPRMGMFTRNIHTSCKFNLRAMIIFHNYADAMRETRTNGITHGNYFVLCL